MGVRFQAENQRLRRVQEINRRNLELQQQTDLEMAKRRARQLGTTTKGGAKKGGMNGDVDFTGRRPPRGMDGRLRWLIEPL